MDDQKLSDCMELMNDVVEMENYEVITSCETPVTVLGLDYDEPKLKKHKTEHTVFNKFVITYSLLTIPPARFFPSRLDFVPLLKSTSPTATLSSVTICSSPPVLDVQQKQEQPSKMMPVRSCYLRASFTLLEYFEFMDDQKLLDCMELMNDVVEMENYEMITSCETPVTVLGLDYDEPKLKKHKTEHTVLNKFVITYSLPTIPPAGFLSSRSRYLRATFALCMGTDL